MIQEATSRVAALWRHGIGLSARSDSDPVERVTWFCYQIKKWYHYPARGLAFKRRQRYSVCLFLFSYTREVFCVDLLTIGFFKLVFKLYLLPRDPNRHFIAYSSLLDLNICNFCFQYFAFAIYCNACLHLLCPWLCIDTCCLLWTFVCSFPNLSLRFC